MERFEERNDWPWMPNSQTWMVSNEWILDRGREGQRDY